MTRSSVLCSPKVDATVLSLDWKDPPLDAVTVSPLTRCVAVLARTGRRRFHISCLTLPKVFLAMMSTQQMQHLLFPTQLQALIQQKQQALMLQQVTRSSDTPNNWRFIVVPNVISAHLVPKWEETGSRWIYQSHFLWSFTFYFCSQIQLDEKLQGKFCMYVSECRYSFMEVILIELQ